MATWQIRSTQFWVTEHWWFSASMSWRNHKRFFSPRLWKLMLESSGSTGAAGSPELECSGCHIQGRSRAQTELRTGMRLSFTGFQDTKPFSPLLTGDTILHCAHPHVLELCFSRISQIVSGFPKFFNHVATSKEPPLDPHQPSLSLNPLEESQNQILIFSFLGKPSLFPNPTHGIPWEVIPRGNTVTSLSPMCKIPAWISAPAQPRAPQRSRNDPCSSIPPLECHSQEVTYWNATTCQSHHSCTQKSMLSLQQIILGGGGRPIFTIQSPNRWQIPVSGFVARIEWLRHICHKQHSQPFLSKPLFPSHCFDTNRFPLEIQELCLHIIQPSAFPGPKAWHWGEQLCVSSWFGKTKFTMARLSCIGGQKESMGTPLNHPLIIIFLSFPLTARKTCVAEDLSRCLSVNFTGPA